MPAKNLDWLNDRGLPASSGCCRRAASAEVLGAEAAKKPRLLLVDVSGLTFIDSAALHEIVRAHRELRAEGCLLARQPEPRGGPDS
jgi:hypothetical protein